MKLNKTRDWRDLLPDESISWRLCIICLFAVISFYPAINGDFVFDDSEAVLNNEDVKPTAPLHQVFTNDFWGTHITHNASHKSYRPLTILSYRLNVLAAGGELHASQFRLVNLLLYIVVCCLSFFVCKTLCGSESLCQVPFVASLLFTVHPVHTEAVAPVVGRADLLCALFMFSAFIVYHRCLNYHSLLLSILCTVLTILLAAASMFTKELGITILGICCTHDLLQRNKSLARLLLRNCMLLSAATALLLLRVWIMGGTVPVFQQVDNPASFLDSVYFRVVNYGYIYVLNVWLLFCPEWLCFDWSMGCVPLIHSTKDPRVVIVVVSTCLFGLLVFSSLTNIREKSRQVMALVFMVVPFLPASNMFFRVGFVIAERTLLVPSLGFCLFVALGFRQLTETRYFHLVAPFLLNALVLLFCVRSHTRARQWSTERELFLSALAVCPLNAKVHYNLAKTSSNHSTAMQHYRDALRLHPQYDQAMNNLANILKDVGDLSEAESLLRKALQLRPDFAAAWMNLGIVLSNKKQLSEAKECYWNAIKHRRNYPNCFYNLGNLYLEEKDHSKAYDSWRQATTLDPKHLAAWNNLIIMLDSLGKHEEASSVGQEALAVLPDSAAIHFNIANALGKTSNFFEAEKHFKAAIHLNSQHPLYYVNLGVLYHHWKKFGLAKEFYLSALKLNPNLKSAQDNLRLLQNRNL